MNYLTDRQRDVLFYAACGMGQKATARELGIGEQTVNDHRARAVAAMGADSITAAVVFAIHSGQIKTADVMAMCRETA
jgi:DNA-binding NarL/FixJ family response regulator